MHSLDKLSPFKYYIMTSFPYIEEDFDALTNYELFCKVTKYLNDISESQNNVIDNFNEVYAAWLETKAYIDNYFDNLDVQEEINTKLDDLVRDGTLSNLLQDIYGNRLGVEIVDSTSGMTDITKVYILANDPNGYLWFWNGSAFEESTINYFNPINALGFLASDNIDDLNNLYRQATAITSDNLVNVLNTPNTTTGILVVDYSINNNSSVQIAYSFANSTDPIFWIRKKSSGTWSEWFYINTEKYIEIEGNLTAGDITDLDNSIVSVDTDHLAAVDNLPESNRGLIVYDITSTDSARYQICLNYAYNDVPVIYCRKSSSAGSWSRWYEITGNYWHLIATGDLNDYDYPVTVYWTTDSGKNIANNPIRMGAGYCKTEYNYLRSGCIQEVGSWANNYIGMKFIRTKQSGSNNWSSWNIINPDIVHNSYGFTVIGDSLSSGVTTRTQNGNNSLSSFNMESWEKILANKIGCKVYSCSRSGASTVDWLNPNNNFGITKFNKLPVTPVYCINLGVNDYNQTVGETAFKNNYRTIINTIRQKSANAIILCFKLWRSGNYDTYNDYISDVLSEFTNDDRILMLDIQSKILSTPISNHLYNGHYSVIGYKLIADAVEEEFINIANAHPALFRYEFSQIAEGTSGQNNGYPYIL